MYGFTTSKTIRALIALLIMVPAALLWAGTAASGEKVNPNDILKNKEWQDRYDAFNGDPAVIKAIAENVKADTAIIVYFAFWCHDSVVNVPPFMKIIHQINLQRRELYQPPIPVQYVSLERKADKSVAFFVEEKQVKRVPTFIFYQKDKELGRIIENPEKSLPEDIRQIFRQP